MLRLDNKIGLKMDLNAFFRQNKVHYKSFGILYNGVYNK